MIIKQAIIRGFGKFVNQTFDFSDGLTVIEGENEAGKSTLHAFIEGILYGFLNPTKKKKQYFEAYTRYQPLSTHVYGGALIVELNDITYRIDRNLDKSKHAVTVTEAATGKDITHTLDIDPATKLPDIASWLEIPYFMYKNTLSVSQLALKPTADASGFVEALNAIGSTGGGFNAEKAKAYLKQKLDAIGSHQARTKPYKQKLDQQSALKEKRDKTKTILDDVKKMRENREQHAEQLTKLEADLACINTKIKRVENTIKRKRYEALDTLYKEKEKLSKTLKEHQHAKDYEPDTLENYTKLSRDIEKSKETIQNAKESIKLLGDTSVDDANKIHTIEQCEADLAKREATEVIYTKSSKTLKNAKIIQWSFFALTLLAILIGGVLSIGYAHLIYWGLLSGLIAIVFVITTVLSVRRRRNVEAVLQKTLSAIEALHQHYGLKSDAPYQDFRDRVLSIKNSREQAKTNAEKIREYQEKIQTEKGKLDESLDKQKVLLTAYGLNNEEELKAFDQSYRTYQKTQEKLNNIETRIQDLLGSHCFEDFKASIDFDAPLEDESNYDTLVETRKTLDETIRTKEREINRLDGAIEREEEAVDSLESIDANLEALSQEIQALTRRRETLERAISLLDKAIDAMERTLAPELNEAVNNIMKICTDNRYDSIKMLRDFSFKVDVAQTEQTDLYFSHGTKDQIHFAMRMGMLDALGLTHAPVLLDEAFTLSDDTRLKNILTWLHALAQSKQILLFTAHGREHKILNALNLNHSIIPITAS